MSETSEERILRVATALFARHGFDGVTTRQIAAAARLNIATVHHHVGSKEALYQAVFRRAFERESEVLLGNLERLRPQLQSGPAGTRAALRGLADAYLDFLIVAPEVAFLWVRRGLDVAGRRDEIDEAYSRPLFRALEQELRHAAERGAIPEADFTVVLNGVLWVINGFVTNGILSAEGGEPEGRPPEQVEQVRAFLHTVIDAVTGAESPPAPRLAVTRKRASRRR